MSSSRSSARRSFGCLPLRNLSLCGWPISPIALARLRDGLRLSPSVLRERTALVVALADAALHVSADVTLVTARCDELALRCSAFHCLLPVRMFPVQWLRSGSSSYCEGAELPPGQWDDVSPWLGKEVTARLKPLHRQLWGEGVATKVVLAHRNDVVSRPVAGRQVGTERIGREPEELPVAGHEDVDVEVVRHRGKKNARARAG